MLKYLLRRWRYWQGFGPWENRAERYSLKLQSEHTADLQPPPTRSSQRSTYHPMLQVANNDPDQERCHGNLWVSLRLPTAVSPRQTRCGESSCICRQVRLQAAMPKVMLPYCR